MIRKISSCASDRNVQLYNI